MEQAQELRQEYRYYAFISYSHRDMSWAKWLQGKLERYRLPTQIRKAHIDLPRKIAPVFRDQTDLAGSVLEEALRRELERSQYLIVICSPNSRRSDYVNEEIKYFLSLGRKDRIIPFVVEGEPYSKDPARECFPPAIRKLKPELLGVNALELGKKNAFLRLVATLLRLPADEVIMREKKRTAVRRGIAAVLGVLLTLVLAAVIWHNTEHSRYYSAYTYRYEVPEGVCELTKDQRANARECYRLTTLRGKVIRIETVDPAGQVVAPAAVFATTEYPVMEFTYDDGGTLIRVTQYDNYGRELTTKSLSYPEDGTIVIEYSSGVSGEPVSLSADLSRMLAGSEAEAALSRVNRQVNTYDETGLLESSRYYWHSGFNPACDKNGIYGKRFSYNEAGLITAIQNLNADGEPFNCGYGWAECALEYNAMGKVTATGFFAADGAPALCKEGFHGERMTYDGSGNLLEQAVVDGEGNLCAPTEGMAKLTMEYDGGLLLSVRGYNAQGRPDCDENGVHAELYEYDRLGRMTQVTFLDRQDRAVEGLGGYTLRIEYDAAGDPVRAIQLSASGEVTFVREYRYDDHHREVSLSFYDGEGGKRSLNGYHSLLTQYDSLGNVTKRTYCDTDGAPVVAEAGYAIREYAYDESGNITEIRYCDAGGSLTERDGFAIVRQEYENGNHISTSYYGVEGEPVLNDYGVHAVRWEYNDVGVVLLREYSGTDGAPINCTEGFARVEQVCDAKGNVTVQRYFDSSEAPALLNGEYHETRIDYDEKGQLLRQSYYDTEGALICNSEGFAVKEWEHDAYGNILTERFFGADGAPILLNGQYHKVCYAYDPEDNNTEQWLFGVDGAPVVVNGIHGWQKVYSDGKVVLDKSFGADGKLTLNSQGCAVKEFAYDEQGNLIHARFFGAENEPILFVGMCHELRAEYDENGNMLSAAYYDTEGKLIYEERGGE